MIKQKINESNGIKIIRNKEFFVCTSCNLRYPIYTFVENNDKIYINVCCECKTYSKNTSQILEKRNNIEIGRCCMSELHFNDILYCVKCEKSFCKECRKIHNQLAKNDEFYLSIEDNENNILCNSHCFIDTKIYFNAKCSSHFLPKVFYCDSSKIYICKKCCETGHNNCNHISIRQKWKKTFRQKNKEFFRTKIDELRQNFLMVIDSLDRAVENKPGSLTRKTLHSVLSEVRESVENKNNLISFVVNRIIDDFELIKEHNIYNVYYYETFFKIFNFSKPKYRILQDNDNEINIHKIFELKKSFIAEVERKQKIMKYYSFEVNKVYCLLQFNSDYLITGEDNIFQIWKGIFPVSNGKVMAHKGKKGTMYGKNK